MLEWIAENFADLVKDAVWIAMFIDFMLFVTGSKSIIGWICDKLGI